MSRRGRFVGSGPFLGWIINWAFAHQKLKQKKKEKKREEDLPNKPYTRKKKGVLVCVRVNSDKKERKQRERKKKKGVRV